MDTTTALCGVQKAVYLIGSKWVLLILHNLCSEPKGFNELLRSVSGISPALLSRRLKDLVDHGLVVKEVFSTTPPTVEYRMAPKGEALKKILVSLGTWADTI